MEGKGKTFLAFPCFAEGFASAEATKGLSGRPLETFGALLLERIGFFTKTRFLVEGRGKTLLAFPCFAEGFASAEATKGLSARPLETFGAHLLRRIGFSTRNGFLVDGKEKPYLAFPVTQRVSPLRRRPKGFPIALWKPSGSPCCEWELATKSRFLVEGRGKTLLAFPCFAEDFASAEATKGLSARPLETFGALLLGRIGFFTKTRFLVEGRGKTLLAFPCFAEGFASAEATRGLSARPLDPFGGLLCDEMLASREAERYLFATPTIFQ